MPDMRRRRNLAEAKESKFHTKILPVKFAEFVAIKSTHGANNANGM
jgi:hypothetical protein